MAIGIFADESGMVGTGHYFMFGLLKTDTRTARLIEARIHELRGREKFPFEVSYKKTDKSKNKVAFFIKIVDLFLETDIKFHGYVLDNRLWDTRRYKQNLLFIPAEELSYNYHFKRAVQWSLAPEEAEEPLVIIINQRGKRRPEAFHDYLKKELPAIKDLQEVPSKGHELVQMADLLCGLMRGDIEGYANQSRREVIDHLKHSLGISSFFERTRFTSRKFRTWFYFKPE